MGEILLLGRDKVASIRVLGGGKLGEKSVNLFRKERVLEDCGFLFPRRNLVIASDLLLDGLAYAGHKDGWEAASMPQSEEFRRRFCAWMIGEVWPAAEDTFNGRAFYVRSDTIGDALGRDAYVSVPFVKNHINYRCEQDRARALSGRTLDVARSYFDEVGVKFRQRCGLPPEGINVFYSQFIGRVGNFILGGRKEKALAPFISAVVKTRLVSGSSEGVIRFEYGLGSGALRGKTIIVGQRGVQTVLGRRKVEGIDTSSSNANPEIIALPNAEHMTIDNSNWVVVAELMNSAYHIRNMEAEAASMLEWLAHNCARFEKLNGGPLYLELIGSSFKKNDPAAERKLRWFVVQAADYQPSEPIGLEPGIGCFISNADFSGHGVVRGERPVFVFGPDAFIGGDGMERLKRINEEARGYVVILPQAALTGVNLSDMSASHLSNASAVVEY